MYLYVSYMKQLIHTDGQSIQVFGQPQAACDVEPCMVSRYGRTKQKKNSITLPLQHGNNLIEIAAESSVPHP